MTLLGKDVEGSKNGKGDGKGGGKGGPKGGGTGTSGAAGSSTQQDGQKKECKFFLTKGGCTRGRQCNFRHRKLLASEGRCFNCGSTEHGIKECMRRSA